MVLTVGAGAVAGVARDQLGKIRKIGEADAHGDVGNGKTGVGEKFQREPQAEAAEILHGRDPVVFNEYTVQRGPVDGEAAGEGGDVEAGVGEVEVEPCFGASGGVGARVVRGRVGLR